MLLFVYQHTCCSVNSVFLTEFRKQNMRTKYILAYCDGLSVVCTRSSWSGVRIAYIKYLRIRPKFSEISDMVHMFESSPLYVERKFFIHTQDWRAGNAVAYTTVATSCNWWLFVAAAIRCTLHFSTLLRTLFDFIWVVVSWCSAFRVLNCCCSYERFCFSKFAAQVNH